jgi:hypothetical protein
MKSPREHLFYLIGLFPFCREETEDEIVMMMEQINSSFTSRSFFNPEKKANLSVTLFILSVVYSGFDRNSLLSIQGQSFEEKKKSSPFEYFLSIKQIFLSIVFILVQLQMRY